MLFGIVSPCTTLPYASQERPFAFLQFGQVENIHGHIIKKNFLISFSPLFPQAEQKEDDEHFANHQQMYVSRTFTKAKKSVLCAEYPISSKFHFSKWKTYFSQFIDDFLKIGEVEYLIHHAKFNIWPASFYVNSLCFPLFLSFGVIGSTLFPPIDTDIENWNYGCCSRLEFPIFSNWWNI